MMVKTPSQPSRDDQARTQEGLLIGGAFMSHEEVRSYSQDAELTRHSEGMNNAPLIRVRSVVRVHEDGGARRPSFVQLRGQHSHEGSHVVPDV
jgi:hypothetical protein